MRNATIVLAASVLIAAIAVLPTAEAVKKCDRRVQGTDTQGTWTEYCIWAAEGDGLCYGESTATGTYTYDPVTGSYSEKTTDYDYKETCIKQCLDELTLLAAGTERTSPSCINLG